MAQQRLRIVCAVCGSRRIERDSRSIFDEELGRWTLASVSECYHCQDCKKTVPIRTVDTSRRPGRPASDYCPKCGTDYTDQNPKKKGALCLKCTREFWKTKKAESRKGATT